uniref:PI3K/PI4K catalytic domain-containing protein n=1 Tax=Arcella intermedia TaxID=1963864 RepID=A0A6B2L185_9EUKA
MTIIKQHSEERDGEYLWGDLTKEYSLMERQKKKEEKKKEKGKDEGKKDLSEESKEKEDRIAQKMEKSSESFKKPKPEKKKEDLSKNDEGKSEGTASESLVGPTPQENDHPPQETKAPEEKASHDNETPPTPDPKQLGAPSVEKVKKTKKSGKGKPKSKHHKNKMKEFYIVNEEIILYQQLLNKNLSAKSFQLLDDEVVEKYFPVFLQIPELLEHVTERMKNPKIQQTAFWCYKAKLKMANAYLKNISWLGDTEKLNRTWSFFSNLAANFPLKEGEQYEGLDLCDPMWKAGTIHKIKVLKIFKSAHSPCLIELHYTNPDLKPALVVFKDDDVRGDMMVNIIWGVCNTLWRSSGLKSNPDIVKFEVVPGSTNFGFIEFLDNSVTLRDYNLTKIPKFSNTQMDRFLSTTSAAFIGGFILGIRDRHEDNFLIRNDTDFLQLDFGFLFNNKTRGIDGCRFAISHRLKNAIDAQDDTFSRWVNFKERASAAYLILRRNSHVLLHMARILFKDMFPGSQIELEIIKSFYLDRTEEEAIQHIQELIEMGIYSVKRIVKNVSHDIYQLL